MSDIVKLVEWSKDSLNCKNEDHQIRAIEMDEGWLVLHLKREVTRTSVQNDWEVEDDWYSESEPEAYSEEHDVVS